MPTESMCLPRPTLGIGLRDIWGGRLGDFLPGGFGDAGTYHCFPDSGQQCFVRFSKDGRVVKRVDGLVSYDEIDKAIQSQLQANEGPAH